MSLNGLPNFRAEIDGLGIHFVHVRVEEPGALATLHFAAWEEPELLARDIREFFRPLR